MTVSLSLIIEWNIEGLESTNYNDCTDVKNDHNIKITNAGIIIIRFVKGFR